MSENSSDRRTALIAALISIPAAVLISMVVHHFLPVPTEPIFGFSQSVDPAPVQVPAFQAPKQNRPGPAAKESPAAKPAPANNDLTPLYQKKIKIANKILKETENAFKSGSIRIIDVIPAKTELLMAEGELFRYQNKIRRFGNSVSDLAVKYEAAKQVVKYLTLEQKQGSIKSTELLNSKINLTNLEIQLKSNRMFRNSEWQNVYAAYQKDPSVKTYLAMLEAERAIQPPRRF